ncbi:MAG: TrmH family RNA methyltransferase [Thermoleophilia bacterium]
MTEFTNPEFPGAEALRDHRNVIDHFKYWRHDAIRAALDTRRAPFVVVLENFAHDFNISTAIRNANAFVAREVWITGRRRYDRRGAQGTHRYEHVHHAPTTGEVLRRLRAEGLRIVAVDNIEGAASLIDHRWRPESAMVFGQEQIGVSPEALELADDVVYIPQYGSTRSINVGTASGIAMFSYAMAVMGAPQPWDGVSPTHQ